MIGRRVKYLSERRHIVNHLQQGGSRLVNGRRAAADAVFKCSLNKRSPQFPVPLSMSVAADRRQQGTALASNGAQVSSMTPSGTLGASCHK